MDSRKTVHTHGPGQGDDQEETSQQASDEEYEVMPTLQHPSRPPDTPLQLGGGLQNAHSRLAELLRAAASILAEITASGGGVAGDHGENWRQAAARCSTVPQRDDWRQTQAPATGTAMQLDLDAILTTSTLTGGDLEHHVRESLQSPPPTSLIRDRRRHDQPVASAREAAVSMSDGTAREHQEPGAGQAFQQRLPVLTAFRAKGGDWGAFQQRFLAHQEMSGWTDAEALCAHPASLDDDALATFRSTPSLSFCLSLGAQ
ncbi:unnamed protein product [Lampetra fluviatilis]